MATEKEKEQAENQIKNKVKEIDFIRAEYTVEVLVRQYKAREIYTYDKSETITWDKTKQSTFIESILLGIPVNPVLLADMNDDGSLAILSGSEKIATLELFIEKELVLEGISELWKLRGFTYNDLGIGRRKRFCRATIQTIILTEHTTNALKTLYRTHR